VNSQDHQETLKALASLLFIILCTGVMLFLMIRFLPPPDPSNPAPKIPCCSPW